MPAPAAFDLLLMAVAALLECPSDHPDVLSTALAIQEVAPYWPDLLRHGWGRLSAYVGHHQVENVAVEFSHKTRQIRPSAK